MKAGDEIVCKKCGKSSFLVKKSIMDGWKKVGEQLLCSSCSAVIHEVMDNKDQDKSEKSEKKSQNKEILGKFADFLGTGQVEKPEINVDEEERHFCRDCKHYISHPFMNRCSLYSKEVNPMDDCKSYKKKIMKE